MTVEDQELYIAVCIPLNKVQLTGNDSSYKARDVLSGARVHTLMQMMQRLNNQANYLANYTRKGT